MKKFLAAVVSVALAGNLFAGAAGLVVKGVLKTWDEVAKVALKVSGKTASDDAVKAAAKTLETTSSKYGDDVARASMRGGIEVAEQVARQGGRFASVVRMTARFSDDALRTMALNGDKAARICAMYGDDVVKSVAKLPVEDGTRLLGAIERNPQVAKELMEEVEKGGKTFLDRLFEVSGRQILAGTLGASAIVWVVRETAPAAAEGDAVRQQTEATVALVKTGKPLSETQKALVESWTTATADSRKTWAECRNAVCMTLAVFAGLSLLVYAFCKSRCKAVPLTRSAGTDATDWGAVSTEA